MSDLENWQGRERRYPDLYNPCKYTLDRIRDEIEIFANSLNDNSKVLDFGCGEKPYYPFFENKAKE